MVKRLKWTLDGLGNKSMGLMEIKGKASRNMKSYFTNMRIAKGSTHNNHKMSQSSKVGSQCSVPFEKKFQVDDK